MRVLIILGFFATAVVSNATAQWCTIREPEPALPCGQSDFERQTIYIQDVSLKGKRLFTAEEQGGQGSDIIAGANVLPSYLCTPSSGKVIIGMNDYPLIQEWQPNSTVCVGDKRVAPQEGVRHVYEVISSAAGNCGTTGSGGSPLVYHHKGVEVEDGQVTWKETGTEGTRAWSPIEYNVGSFVRSRTSADGKVYRCVRVKALSGAGEPNWSTIGADDSKNPSDGGITWRWVWEGMGAPARVGSTFYNSGTYRRPNPSNGFIYESSGGTSAPTDIVNWDPYESSVTDGTITWTRVAVDFSSAPAWTSGFHGRGEICRPSNTNTSAPWNVYVVSIVSPIARTSEPNWPSSESSPPVTDGNYEWVLAGLDGADVDFRATNSVRLKPGFEVLRGARFHAYVKPEWQSCWREEFGTSFSLDTWHLASKPLNREAGHCLFDATQVEHDPSSSKLVLKLTKQSGEGVLNPNDPADTNHYEFKGAEISTTKVGNVKEQRYGKFEFSSRVPLDLGTSSAQWLWGRNGRIAAEFDLQESSHWYNGWNGPNGPICRNYSQITYWEINLVNTGRDRQLFYDTDIDDAYNRYTLEWEPGEIRFLVNDQVYHRLPDNNWREFPRQADGFVHAIIGLGTHIKKTSWIADMPQETSMDVDYVEFAKKRGVNCSEITSAPKVTENRERPSGGLKYAIVPNPTSGTAKEISLILESAPSEHIQIVELELIDLLGRKLHGWMKAGTDVDRGKRFKLALPVQLAAGSYYLRIFTITETQAEPATLRLIVE